ncbi:hypothetical protein NQ314_002293 [Rhamnusium bicolor]|uniref:Gamma-tubulin complex component n=1 Tax=Rhamnusium bicolor TaxID=1586634 RepID=A0AAV8ZRN2_9CUCU|nr:hypothetical protein NQ314_002293 [Rhamnusium bicolor]
MARQIHDDINIAVKELITDISGFEDGTDMFNYVQKHILTTLKKGGTMYFLNKREVDKSIAGMAEKYIFHGFFPQAKALQDSYNSYVTENLAKSELMCRLNIVKFLMCMSERPTSNFLEKPEEFEPEPVEEEEEINWGEYLNEGIERWSPNFDDTSGSSATSVYDDDINDALDGPGTSTATLPVVIDSTDREVVVDLRSNREELLATVQHTWYHQERFHMAPVSKWREANIGILWEQFLEDQVKGLVPIEKASILSEYKVIREILWQLWSLHTSAVFELDGNQLRPKTNVTISSVRTGAFEKFLAEFVPYMEVLDFFREFSKSLEIPADECITTVPQTFRSYNNSLQNIIQPIYKKLSKLEDLVREQETTYTLLKLADELQLIFEPVLLLRKIHKEVVIDLDTNSQLRCATVLLSGLHNSLQYSASKLEQDLRMTLFLDSLYHYFTLIDSWLMKNDLSDYSGEFLIKNNNRNLYASTDDDEYEYGSMSESQSWKLNFDLRGELDEFCQNNGIIKIVRETVLQIGRNIHLLRLLGKFSLINDCKETIHQEFIRKTLEELCKFYNINADESVLEKIEQDEDDIGGKDYKYPVVCTDECKKPTDMDKLENLVDTTDGFLMLAFNEYFIEKPQKSEPKPITLFEKFSLTTNAANKHWGNEIWLTAHLHDTIMDIYPEFYENCVVQVKENWKQCVKSLEACNMVNLQYEIQWPLNIIINPPQMALYKDIFQFLLKIKWALYTVNHLVFTDLEPKKLNKSQPKTHKTTIMKLKYLKFADEYAEQHPTLYFFFCFYQMPSKVRAGLREGQ